METLQKTAESGRWMNYEEIKNLGGCTDLELAELLEVGIRPLPCRKKDNGIKEYLVSSVSEFLPYHA